MKNPREFKDICEFSLKVYRANTNASPNKKRLQTSVNLTVFIFKNGMVLLSTTSILTCIRPCISYYLTGELDTILPTNFPGIDEKQIIGYTCLAVFHVYIMLVFVMGTAGADLGLMTLVIQSYTMSHIFQNAVNEFNALVGEKTRNKNNEEIGASLKNVILMHIDFIKLTKIEINFYRHNEMCNCFRYTRILKTIYNEMCLIQITMANTIMIVLVYVILMVKTQ